MAEALLQRLFEEAGVPAEVRSAGTLGLTDVPAHPNARETAAARGLDLSGHRSTPLTPDVIRWADTVLCMEPAHRRAVLELDSTADARLVSEFGPAGEDAILDPIGRSRIVYEEVFEELLRRLRAFVERRTPTRSG